MEKLLLERHKMPNPRCYSGQRPFSHTFLLSSFFPVRPSVRPSVLPSLCLQKQMMMTAHTYSPFLPPSLCRSESRRRLLASPHLSLPSLLFDHSQYRRRRLRRSSSVTPPPSAPHPLGLTHFHRNAAFASSTTTIHNTEHGMPNLEVC